MDKNINYRKAYLDDVSRLVELRKKQLIDEGCYADNNIDKELHKYFSDSIANESLVVWIAEELGEIIATAGVCFFSIHQAIPIIVAQLSRQKSKIFIMN